MSSDAPATGISALCPRPERALIPVSELKPGKSLRAGALDESHMRQLMAAHGDGPPIRVTPTCRVTIDGRRRYKAARLLGTP